MMSKFVIGEDNLHHLIYTFLDWLQTSQWVKKMHVDQRNSYMSAYQFQRGSS